MTNLETRIARIEEIIGDDTEDGIQLEFSTSSIDECRESLDQIKIMKKELQLLSREFSLEHKGSAKKKKELIKQSEKVMDFFGGGSRKGSISDLSMQMRENLAKESLELDQIKLLIEKIILQLDKMELKIQKQIENRKALENRKPIPSEIQKFVWNRDGGQCVNCGSTKGLEFDHIIPISKGGGNTSRNIQLLCEKCNREKGAKIGG